MEIPSTILEIMTEAFTQGLRENNFFRSIAKKSLKEYEELLARAKEYINMEEA